MITMEYIILTQGMGRCDRGGDAIVMRTANFIIVIVVKNVVFCPRASDLTAGEALTKNWAMLDITQEICDVLTSR